MGAMWQPAGTQSSHETADLWAAIASLNQRLTAQNAEVRELNAIALQLQERLDGRPG